MKRPAILAVTPARNEATYLPRLLECMDKQTIKPCLWMIVDDGSTDATPRIVDSYAKSRKWVQYVGLPDRGRYYRGKGVAEVFSFGVTEAAKALQDWDLLAKIDADTELPDHYFGLIASKFAENLKLGIASGVNVGELGITLHPRGNNRIYRRECWESLGGLPAISGWDTWDETKARSRGWITAAYADIQVRHLRPEAGTFKYSYQQGRISRFLGYSWLFALGRSFKICYQRNPVCGLGYVLGYMVEKSRIADEEFTSLLRAEQNSRLRVLLHLPAS